MIPVGILTAQATSSFSFLLDLYPSASIAYSFRKLRAGYTGSCIRVRRSSDNTESDIGFVNNLLDTTTLLTFCGSGSGYITNWYDQSGNSYNMVQTTIANQPQIVNLGSLQTTNSKPALFFDGTNDFLQTGTLSVSNINPCLFEVFKINATSQFVVNVINTYNLAGNNGGGSAPDGLTKLSRYKNNVLTSTTTQGQVWTAYNTNTQILSSQFFATIGAFITQFGISNFSAWPLKGYYQEIVGYTTSQISNNSGINSNINSFYTIY
jgi:hypothetical protein